MVVSSGDIILFNPPPLAPTPLFNPPSVSNLRIWDFGSGPDRMSKFSRLRRAKSEGFPLVHTSKPQKFSRLRRAIGQRFPLYRLCFGSLQAWKKIGLSERIQGEIQEICSPQARFFFGLRGRIQGEMLGFCPPQARNFWGFEGIYKGKCKDFARRRRDFFFSDFLKIWPASQKVVFNPPLCFRFGRGKGGG